MSDNEKLNQRKDILAGDVIKIWKGTYRNVDAYKAFYQTDDSGPYIIISNYKVIGDLVIDGLHNLPIIHFVNTELYNIVINNSVTKDIFIFDNSVVEGFKINNSKTGTIWGLNKSKIESIRIEKSQLWGIWILVDTSVGYIEITTSIIYTFNVYAGVVDHIYVKDDTKINKLSMQQINRESKSLTISDCNIGELELKLSNPYNITIKAVNPNKSSIIQRLRLVDTTFPSGANMNISQTSINHLKIGSFINQGIIVFSDVIPIDIFDKFQLNQKGIPIRDENGSFQLTKSIIDENPSTIEIKDSVAGNMQFIGCNLATFSKFLFKNSNLQNIFLADTQLPAKEKITTDKTDLFEQRRLVLSQIKRVFEGQGDAVRASEYRAEEMEVYRHFLLSKTFLPTRKARWNRRAELANLWLNKFSSYYGNNWLRGLVVTFCISVFLYISYCSASGIYPASLNNYKNWETFGRLIPYYFEFLNPVHKSDFFAYIKAGEPNPMALLIDYISRIIIAYLVYQTIAAFRKFGKRST